MHTLGLCMKQNSVFQEGRSQGKRDVMPTISSPPDCVEPSYITLVMLILIWLNFEFKITHFHPFYAVEKMFKLSRYHYQNLMTKSINTIK